MNTILEFNRILGVCFALKMKFKAPFVFVMSSKCLNFFINCIVGLVVLLASLDAFAFKIEKLIFEPSWFDGHPPNHEVITKSLYLYRPSSSPAGVYFMPQVVDFIVSQNVLMDSKDWDYEPVHFDNETLAEGSLLLLLYSGEIFSSAMRGDYHLAQALLGQALHTVQDFYAHTNWVEIGNNDIERRLGKELIPISMISPIAATSCTAGGLVQGKTLTSGYFSLYELKNNDLQWWTFPYTLNFRKPDWPHFKCIHGDLGAGLHKDDDSRPNFEMAKALAIKATQAYADNIIERLKLAGNSNAICGLMTGSVCQSQISFMANTFQSGVNVALGGPGDIYGSNVLLNAPPYHAVPNQADFVFYVTVEGKYDLWVEYAAAESRPVSISINGRIALVDALYAKTGGWLPTDQKFLNQGSVMLPQGLVRMRVSRSDVFPHIRAFMFKPVLR